jgi:DNA-binding response OmpR family regulator/REP element-mobilizing transposase RayT
MDLKILIATPDRSFGKQISQALQEANYSPLLAPSTAEAAYIVQYEKCPIAILDCDLPDPGPAYLAAELRDHFTDLRIIFIHPGKGSAEPFKINSALDIYLPRPFFMPDLLEVIHLWVAEKRTSLDQAQSAYESQPISSELAWLQDVDRAAQYLTRISLEVDAEAALIIRNTQIWAYAGQLSQAAAVELTQFVRQHWTNSDGSELARFVRLETTGSDYMLYVTSLGSGFVLALSFKAEMPFSRMRAQTGQLARKLTSPELEPPEEIINSPVPEEPPQQKESATPEEYKSVPETDDEFKVYETDDEETRSVDEALIERQQAMFEDLLATLDIPDPDGSSRSLPTKPGRAVKFQHQTPAILPEIRVTSPLVLDTVPAQDENPFTQSGIQLEPESLAQHDLAYSCVLIPRLPNHHLTDVLTGLLNVEMSRYCLAFGWRLEHLDIRPEFINWVVGVTPDVSASQVIRKIREQTSALIFSEFPRLAKENPSGDFWTPGFLVIHGRRSLDGSLVQDYIQQTRARQGIDHT